MTAEATGRAPFPDDQGFALWLRYLEVAGDRAMAVRLEAMQKVARAGRAVAIRTEGTSTAAPLIVAAEAAASVSAGRDERQWREDWVRRLVQLAVTWSEESSTEGVVCMLTLTDRIIEDLKAAGTWPWPTAAAAAPAAGAAQAFTYMEEDMLAAGMHVVQGADYVVWHRLLEMSGDGPVATRLSAVHAASQSNCKMVVTTADGRRLCFPMMIVAEGAVAAKEGKSEAAWREEWTRRCVRIVSRWPGPEMIDAATALLTCTPSVTEELEYARVWPWLGAQRADHSSRRPGANARPPGPPA